MGRTREDEEAIGIREAPELHLPVSLPVVFNHPNTRSMHRRVA
jgi:hypothetical protein